MIKKIYLNRKENYVLGNVERPRLSEFDLEVPEKCIGQNHKKKR